MDDCSHHSQRQLLASLATGGAVALVGCAESDPRIGADTASGSGANGTKSEPTASDNLNLKEAM